MRFIWNYILERSDQEVQRALQLLEYIVNHQCETISARN